jgi:penicillin-binding protein activator
MQAGTSVTMRAVTTGALLLIAVLPIACGKKVTRIDPNSVTDLSGRWNDTDSRLVANELITQTISSQWANRYSETHGGETPAVLVGDFRNETMEHIPVGTFLGDLERALIGTGAVRVVASKTERVEIRDERRDQQQNARADTRAKMAQELGAKFILQGTLQAIEDSEGREKIVYYQVDATLIDIESNVKVWTGQKKIKKYIERPRIRM